MRVQETEKRRIADEERDRNNKALSILPGSAQAFRDQGCPGLCPALVVVPAGKFKMGAPKSEERASKYDGREEPVHEVAINQAVAIGRSAVTRGEFSDFVKETGYALSGGCYNWEGSNWALKADKSWRSPGFEQNDRHPVVCVSYNDGKAYANWLSQKTGRDYRLLSEAEREYVTRAEKTTPFWWGATLSPQQANYNANVTHAGSVRGEYRGKTMPAESFAPNPWGLYNLNGNIWEWVEDCWHLNYNGAPADGSVWKSSCSESQTMVVRGGSWLDTPQLLRTAVRYPKPSGTRSYNLGFRIARSLRP